MAKQINNEENLDVQETLSKSGQWIIKNQNMLMWCVCGILAVIVAIMLFNTYYLKPKSAEADNEIAKAVVYFAADDFEKALNGDEADCIGFEAIAQDYSITKPGKLAALYAGLCHYNLGNYDDAIHYLKKFNANDLNIAPAALMKTGDAYIALGETEKAIGYFQKAAKSGNKLIAPIALKKAGFAQLEMGNKKAAHKSFASIKDNYPESQEAQDIDKYIELAK